MISNKGVKRWQDMRAFDRPFLDRKNQETIIKKRRFFNTGNNEC